MMARFLIKAMVLLHSVELNADKILPLCQWLHLLPHMEYPPMGQVRSLLSTVLCKPPFLCSSWDILPIPSMSQIEPEQVFLPKSQPWAVVGGAACRQRHRRWDWAPALRLGTSIPSALPGCLWAWWRWALGLTSASSSLSTVQTGDLSLPWSLWQASVPWLWRVPPIREQDS